MEKKRFIFDLDYTLMVADKKHEEKYFKDVFRSDSSAFMEVMIPLLQEYERIYKRYDISQLSSFLSSKTRLDFTESVIKGWIESYGNAPNKIEDGVIDTLEYLKSNDHSLVILTNWFLDSQKQRIKNSGLLEYFDEIYAGDFILKPRKEAYMAARSNYRNHDCVYIGDNLDKDYIGPRSVGIYSILYDKNDRHNENIVKIKRMNEIKSLY